MMLCLAIALLCVQPAVAQAPAEVPEVSSPSLPGSPGATTPQDVDYQLVPGDVLRIVVYGNETLPQAFVIQSDGSFLFPFIGPVKAEGLTAKELERKITTLLGSRYIKNPQVVLLVQEYHSRQVYVLGEAGHTGAFSLNQARTLLDIAAIAGISNSAEIQIVRPLHKTQGPTLPTDVSDDGETRQADIIRVSLRDIQSGDLSKNIALQPNDTLFVVAATKVFVSGEVRNPGGYAPPVAATVEKLVLLAGGVTNRGAEGRVDLERVVDGKKKRWRAKADETVEPGDRIIVHSKLF